VRARSRARARVRPAGLPHPCPLPLPPATALQLNFFQPTNKAIKTRIEDLIERDYLERDASDSKILTYCA
jgi:hypothetical protein